MTTDSTTSPGPRVTLRRELGRWDLTAIGINQVIGSAIFLMPADIAREVGSWGPLAFGLAGLASLFLVLCFAEVSSRFDATGGAYLYTRAAFGRFWGFEVGWMQWFTRVSSQASVSNGLVLALAFYWPALGAGLPRALFLTALMAALAWINIRGIKQSAWVINALTIAKLLPLFVFMLVGVAFIEPERLAMSGAVTTEQAGAAALLLIFTFGGWDVISVPAGEARNPTRDAPFAFVMTMVLVTLVMVLTQIVAQGTLPDLTATRTPLADAALLFMGAGGALLLSAGAAVSMTGNTQGQVLSASRMMYGLAENGDLPRVFARLHPRYRTPAVSILFTTVLATLLAVTGSFVFLAAVSAVARLVAYLGTFGATLALRRQGPAPFTVPGGPIVPVVAILIALVILAGASTVQLLGGAGALLLGAVLYFVAGRGYSK